MQKIIFYLYKKNNQQSIFTLLTYQWQNHQDQIYCQGFNEFASLVKTSLFHLVQQKTFQLKVLIQQ